MDSPTPASESSVMHVQLRYKAPRFSLLISLLSLFAVPLAAAPLPEAGMTVSTADGTVSVLAATATDVEIEVSGLVAHARVRQRFFNGGKEFLEGKYRLPLPADGAVFAMRIELDGRLIEGVVREREEARIEYEAARSAGMATALVERQAADIFSTRVANIPPGAEVAVEIEYFQSVGYRDGHFELVFPLTVRPRYGSTLSNDLSALLDASEMAPNTGSVTLPARIVVRLAAGIAILDPRSTSHAIDVVKQERSFDIRTRDERVPADRDFVLSWAPQAGKPAQVASFVEEINGERYLSVMLVPPTLEGPRLPRELILVIDSSGSMMGTAWTGAQRAAGFALAQLKPGDYFNVVDFDSTATALSPMSLPINPQTLATAEEFVNTRSADGGTEIGGAIDTALALPPINGKVRQLVFITDGAVGNEAQIYRQIAAKPIEARLYMVGIGEAPNRAFLRRAAELGRGFAEIIPSTQGIDSALQTLFRRIDAPVLTGIQVQWPGEAEAWPRQIPDLYAGEPLWLSARLRSGDAALQITASGSAGAFSKSIAIGAARPANGAAKIWARRKIQALEDELDLGADEAVVRTQILETALAHKLLSRYTSFVAVEKRIRRAPTDALNKADFANPAPADAAAFAQTAQGWQAGLLSGLALMLIAVFALRRANA